MGFLLSRCVSKSKRIGKVFCVGLAVVVVVTRCLGKMGHRFFFFSFFLVLLFLWGSCYFRYLSLMTVVIVVAFDGIELSSCVDIKW